MSTNINVGGISDDCRWYIDRLLYNTMYFRVFLKTSSVLETFSPEVLKTLRCWHPWKSCWKIDFASILLFWEPLKNPLNVVLQKCTISLKWTNLWKTAFRDLIRYLGSVSRMVWRMGKFLNSCWWVGVFDTLWSASASWWGIRPSKLPTYPGIWTKFFKKVKCPAFCLEGALVILESVSTKCRLQTTADHCFNHAIRTRQK